MGFFGKSRSKKFGEIMFKIKLGKNGLTFSGFVRHENLHFKSQFLILGTIRSEIRSDRSDLVDLITINRSPRSDIPQRKND